jgi:hypothetical protein
MPSKEVSQLRIGLADTGAHPMLADQEKQANVPPDSR